MNQHPPDLTPALPGQPHCTLISDSDSFHLSQIHTGFSLLHSAGEIRLSQECRNQNHFDPAKPQHLRDARQAHLLVIVNGNTKLYYDCHDSHEIDESAAAEVDCYFKRSYAKAAIPDDLRPKVFSLGFNYEIYPATCDSLEQQRLSSFPSQLTEPDEPQFRPNVENMHAGPNMLLARRVLFMTRAWDPFDHPDRSQEKIAERICINETRARCIELLKREFGSRFLGGFVHTDYAMQNYSDALLPDNEASRKDNYIRLLRQYPICVTTTGLHGSIGWKMGEYVAFSRAIISEDLNYEVPGDFKPEQNYLRFDQPDECVNAAHRLLTDEALRFNMMKTNHDYYLSYLKPDAMIRRTLKIGLGRQQ